MLESELLLKKLHPGPDSSLRFLHARIHVPPVSIRDIAGVSFRLVVCLFDFFFFETGLLSSPE